MKIKRGTLLFSLLIALTVLFIFSQSLPGQSVSQAESSRVTALLRPFLGIFIGAEHVTVSLVRKLAHFAEFFCLGAELAALLWHEKRKDVQSGLNSFFFATGIALSDETIQIFTGRGPMIQDVWLDIGGAAAGMLFLSLVRLLLFLWHKKRQKAQK